MLLFQEKITLDKNVQVHQWEKKQNKKAKIDIIGISGIRISGIRKKKTDRCKRYLGAHTKYKNTKKL